MIHVTFQIPGEGSVTVNAAPGDNLLALAGQANVPMDAPCGGSGTCGKCRVKLISGQLDSPKSRHITEDAYREGWRLSCCSRVTEDVTVLVPEGALAYRSRIKTADLSTPEQTAIFEKTLQQLKENGIGFGTGCRCLTLSPEAPSADDTMPDSERLIRAIQSKLDADQVQLPYAVMAKLSSTLRADHFHVCVKGILEGRTFRCMEITGPGDTTLAGCAVDIGTTTVTAVLTDLVTGQILARGSCGNGQIPFGADVISRIIAQGRPGGRQALQDAITKQTLSPLISGLCRSAGISPGSVLRMSIGANTTMNHLLIGADAQPVRMEPYIPSFFFWEGLTAGDMGLPVNPLAPVLIAPNIGSYVGGDITAGTLASGIWNRAEMSLFIDLGTNGEIVFGNQDFLMSCACSAGPAFEGGDISCGMRAADGAIEAFSMDGDSLEPRLKVVGSAGQKPAGICGSGLIDLIAELFRHGIINARGQFIREGKRIRQDEHGCARYVIVPADQSETGQEIFLNEVDIDNFIRAKGAVFSAIDTLLQSVDMTPEEIDAVYVAGGIGSGIHMDNAVRIGMFPDAAPEKFHYIGNTSLAGAYAMTVSDEANRILAQVAANMTYLELSTCPGYMDSFVAACFLPHTDAGRFPRFSGEC